MNAVGAPKNARIITTKGAKTIHPKETTKNRIFLSW